MTERKNNIINSLRDEVGRLFIISFGVFLFILFFQPFPLDTLDYNSRLLYVTGFGLIIFFSAIIALIILPAAIPKWFDIKNEWENGPPLQLSLVLLIITVTAFLFYIRWVGQVNLSLYIMFKAFLVGLLPLVALTSMYKNKSMEREIEVLQDQNRQYISKMREYENDAREEEIDIFTDYKEGKLKLKVKDIILFRSADNYIEVYFLKNETIEKRLIRSTLKNIELQLAKFSDLIRFHRTGIVNKTYVEKLVRDYNGYSLKIKYLEEKIPVSRHNLKLVKEALLTPVQ